MDYAHQSLVLLPENPLFLVVVADVQARQHQNDAAIASAHDALDYFDRFDRLIAIPEQSWPDLKRTQQAMAYFVIGRALIQSALQKPPSQDQHSFSNRARPHSYTPKLSTPTTRKSPICSAWISSPHTTGLARQRNSPPSTGGAEISWPTHANN